MPPPTTTRSNSSARSASTARARAIMGAPSRQVLDDVAGGRARRRLLLLARPPEVDEPEDPLVVGHAARGAALGRPQHGRRAPVAGQPARVGAEQDDVGGAASREQVLLV